MLTRTDQRASPFFFFSLFPFRTRYRVKFVTDIKREKEKKKEKKKEIKGGEKRRWNSKRLDEVGELHEKVWFFVVSVRYYRNTFLTRQDIPVDTSHWILVGQWFTKNRHSVVLHENIFFCNILFICNFFSLI